MIAIDTLSFFIFEEFMRINKYLAGCGVASRRACDQLIADGKVKVNGKTVDKLGIDIDEINDNVTVDGKRIKYKRRDYYIMLHKPKGYVCTVKDDLGRKTVMDLIDINARLFPVGRLDYDTEGLLILTTNGDVAQEYCWTAKRPLPQKLPSWKKGKNLRGWSW